MEDANIARTVLCLLMVVGVMGQDCAPSTAKDRIATGSYSFTLTPFASSLQCYNTTLDSSFISQPQITAGVSSVSSYNSNYPLDFSIRSYILNGTGLASFTVIVNNASWSTLAISYIITSRSDFYAGSYLSTADSLARCQLNQPYALTIPLPSTARPVPSASLAVLILLNGLRTASTGLSLQFTQPVYDSTLGQINTTALTTISQPIQLMYFAYLMVDLSSLSSSGFSYSFSTTSIQGNYLIAGTVGLSTTGLQTAFFAIKKTAYLPCVGTSCSDCQTQASCATLGGQVLNSQCVRCSINQIYTAGVGCVCSSGTYLIGSTCGVCPSGTTYQSSTKTCTVTCPANSYYTGSSCICSSGYYNISGVCQTCPSNSYYTGSSCICSSGYYNVSGACQSCPANSYYTGTSCVCSSGYYNISGVCQACPANSYYSGLGCACSTGYYNISGACQSCPSGTTYNSTLLSCVSSCGQFQSFVGSSCQCISGYTMVNGQCYQTSSSCGSNMYLLNGVCKCLPNMFLYYGGCYLCPANSDVTADQSGCMCRSGYTLTSAYTCDLTTVQSTSSGSSTSSGTTTSTTTTSSTTSGTTTSSGGTVNINGGTASGSIGTTSFYGGSSSFSTTPATTSTTSSTPVTSSTTTTTTTSSCASGASYSNGTCRPQTVIVSNQSVLIQSAVYVNVLGSNLPDTLTRNSCPNCSSLLLISLLGSPSGVTTTLNFIPSTTYQWVATIIFQSTPFQVTMQLRLNPLFSTSFTAAQNNAIFSTTLNPSTIPVYTIPSAAITNSLSSQQDTLGEVVPQSVLDKFNSKK